MEEKFSEKLDLECNLEDNMQVCRVKIVKDIPRKEEDE